MSKSSTKREIEQSRKLSEYGARFRQACDLFKAGRGDEASRLLAPAEAPGWRTIAIGEVSNLHALAASRAERTLPSQLADAVQGMDDPFAGEIGQFWIGDARPEDEPGYYVAPVGHVHPAVGVAPVAAELAVAA